ncbi:Nucleolar protein Nop52 [Balamuthia mandrillaris]
MRVKMFELDGTEPHSHLALYRFSYGFSFFSSCFAFLLLFCFFFPLCLCYFLHCLRLVSVLVLILVNPLLSSSKAANPIEDFAQDSELNEADIEDEHGDEEDDYGDEEDEHGDEDEEDEEEGADSEGNNEDEEEQVSIT